MSVSWFIIKYFEKFIMCVKRLFWFLQIFTNLFESIWMCFAKVIKVSIFGKRKKCKKKRKRKGPTGRANQPRPISSLSHAWPRNDPPAARARPFFFPSPSLTGRATLLAPTRLCRPRPRISPETARHGRNSLAVIARL